MNKKEEKIKALREFREKKGKALIVYLVLRFLVVLSMVRQFMNGNISGVFMCVLTLILFLIPSIIDRKLNVELPNTLEILVLLFIFSAEILGEINEFYIHFSHWDVMLHTTNGFIMAAIGFSLINILNNDDRFHVSLSPVFVSIFALCFSMTVGLFWEFFEYSADKYLGYDMQKDTIIKEVTSVKLDPNNKNNAVTIPIDSLEVNGENWIAKYDGYIDIGLHDTMNDLFVNLLGAIAFSIVGWVYIKDDNRFAENFLPKRKSKSKVNKT